MHGLKRLLALAALLATSAVARAQAPGLGASVELVDPHAFRVCADPRNLPFSDQAHAGFEDKLTEMFAQKLNLPVQYTYFPRAMGFVRNTLSALRCDVIMGDALGDDLVQPTNPYYRSTYVMLYRPGTGLDGVDTIEDKRLQGKHIGVVARTPPAFFMERANLMADAKPYQLMVDTRYDSPAKDMVNDLEAGKIDAALVWGPIGGFYAKQSKTPLTVVPLLKEQGGVPLDYRIVMGVRHSDQAWKRTLNKLIAENQDAINKVLIDYGIPLLDTQGKLIAP